MHKAKAHPAIGRLVELMGCDKGYAANKIAKPIQQDRAQATNQ